MRNQHQNENVRITQDKAAQVVGDAGRKM
ncbi:Fibrinogen gamma chain [Frankliniella fusca]|uniref:Fibrinogen gamma chain n=1 Tax=Frankliniella fusca TaxID=407009 RepID=A0AAE1HCE4_9NEOP|nr:Fibrinogen gamma chain [Frankliniella fusca]